jgi:hypothetical protein
MPSSTMYTKILQSCVNSLQSKALRSARCHASLTEDEFRKFLAHVDEPVMEASPVSRHDYPGGTVQYTKRLLLLWSV